MNQITYLEILLNDCGFNRTQRNIWLSDLLKRDIRYLDQLVPFEISAIINILKDKKEDMKEKKEEEEEDED